MLFDSPLLTLLCSLALLALSAWLGATRFKRMKAQVAVYKDEFGVVQGATLTLLALIIGFTFSMAIGRYDQRKNLEEAEANAIGTEYVRADLLPAADAAKVRALLVSYLDQRVQFYTNRDGEPLTQIDTTTARLQSELWSAITTPSLAKPTPMMALVVSGMNDVLNSQGYTQAAWWNRIPRTAWAMMLSIAVCTTMLVGIGMRAERGVARVLVILPVIISISFFLISDIDSPRHGIIRVVPQNLVRLGQSLRAS